MLADRLAHYTQSLRFKDLPGDVVHEVKRRILDSLGCAFGAWTATPCRIAREMALAVKVPGGRRCGNESQDPSRPRDLRQWRHGPLPRLQRYLSVQRTGASLRQYRGSPGCGETAHASGELIIQALTLSYEIQCRLCDAAALRPRGWDHVTYGPSSALGIANVLKLTDAQTRQAVNLAGVPMSLCARHGSAICRCGKPAHSPTPHATACSPPCSPGAA